METRLSADMDYDWVILEMSETNLEAAEFCQITLGERGKKIDPDDVMLGLGPLLTLDFLKIYGGRLAKLYKKVCDGNAVKVIALLRANQLGGLAGATDQAINHAIDNDSEVLDFDAIIEAVQNELPSFNVLA